METTTLSTQEKKDQLLAFVPEDVAVEPMQFISLVMEQILGRDKQGNLRPAADLKLFLYQCKRTGLDPMARQIFAIYRSTRQPDGSYKDKMTIQTSIDGFRLVAERSGKYAGQAAAEYEHDDKGKLVAASVTVYKITSSLQQPFPTTARAEWNEYAQTSSKGELTGLWAKMPKTMLGKVAEALALRKAFPQELSGLYTPEEMAQSTNIIPSQSLTAGKIDFDAPVTPAITPEEIKPAPKPGVMPHTEETLIKIGKHAGQKWGSVNDDFLAALLMNAKGTSEHVESAKREVRRREDVVRNNQPPLRTLSQHLRFFEQVYEKFGWEAGEL